MKNKVFDIINTWHQFPLVRIEKIGCLHNQCWQIFTCLFQQAWDTLKGSKVIHFSILITLLNEGISTTVQKMQATLNVSWTITWGLLNLWLPPKLCSPSPFLPMLCVEVSIAIYMACKSHVKANHLHLHIQIFYTYTYILLQCFFSPPLTQD